MVRRGWRLARPPGKEREMNDSMMSILLIHCPVTISNIPLPGGRLEHPVANWRNLFLSAPLISTRTSTNRRKTWRMKNGYGIPQDGILIDCRREDNSQVILSCILASVQCNWLYLHESIRESARQISISEKFHIFKTSLCLVDLSILLNWSVLLTWTSSGEKALSDERGNTRSNPWRKAITWIRAI